jgi:pseudaminic acid biosynthesis-associated methylase
MARTEQEAFWSGEFGDAYADRNNGADWVASNTALFSKILHQTGGLESVMEFGCNRGLNLRALRQLLPTASLTGLELNAKAAALAEKEVDATIIQTSIFDFDTVQPHDMTLIKGVLIHLNPDMLPVAYDALYHNAKRFVCIAEYYNPSPVAIPYRGHQNKLFKRDFAGEFMAKFPNTRLVDYGFVYHKDPLFPQDDINWFLIEKTAQ